MAANKPLLSICMPTYNRLNHIKRQLRYFQNELKAVADREVELIISNNASSDGTKEYLESVEKSFPQVIINHNKKNIGAVNNMDLMAQIAHGKYIWFPGDDDYLKIGLVSEVVKILKDNDLSYLFLSTRGINEETKKIRRKGRKLPIAYDRPIKVDRKELVNLLKENFSSFKFQTASIFLRNKALLCEKEIRYYPEEIKWNDHSLFRSIRAMQDGDQISWAESRIKYVAVLDPQFIEGLFHFGFSKAECKKIKKMVLSKTLCCIFIYPDMFRQWKEAEYPGWNITYVPTVLFLVFRRALSCLGLSKHFFLAEVSPEDFGIVEDK